MAYCTREDLIRRFTEKELRELADPDGIGSISDEVLNEAIADSDEEIDGALRDGGYSPPLITIPPRLTRHACSLVRWFLYSGLRPDEVEKDYERAMDFLGDIKSGKVKIVQQEHEGSTTRPAVKARTKVFDNDFVEDYDLFPW